MSSEKRKIAYIDGKPYEIGANHSSILKFVKSYVGEKKVPTLCDDPNLAPYGACRVCSVEVALEKDGPTKVVASCHTPVATGVWHDATTFVGPSFSNATSTEQTLHAP